MFVVGTCRRVLDQPSSVEAKTTFVLMGDLIR